MKKFLILIASIIIIFGIYVTIESIRLEHSKFYTKPLITLKEELVTPEDKRKTKYTGIGYSIRYFNNTKKTEDGVIITSGYGAEFLLFDKILIWTCVE